MRPFLSLFFCTYLFLYIFPFPLDLFIPLDWIEHRYDIPAKYFGKLFFSLENIERPEMTGSGDTRMDYLCALTVLIFSVLIASIAFLFARVRNAALSLLTAMMIYARFYLAIYLMIYGIAKLYSGGQFGELGFYRLDAVFGDMSPMGLLWSFMAYSKPYTVFIGIAEMSAGILLLFRGTSLIGAILGFGVMLNVFLLNMFYDVPVKLFSFHLTLVAFALGFQNFRQIVIFLSGGRPEALKFYAVPITDRMTNRAIFFSKLGLVVLGVAALFVFDPAAESGDTFDTLNGVYVFEETGEETPFPKEWKRMAWESLYVSFTTDSGHRIQASATVDTLAQTMKIQTYADSMEFNIRYVVLGHDKFRFDAVQSDDATSVVAKRRRKEDFLLTGRGFHWISEYPFNR